MFTGPEYEHLNFICKAFLLAESGSRNNKKTNNYGGLLNFCEFLQTEKTVLKQVRYFEKDELLPNVDSFGMAVWSPGSWFLPTHTSSTSHLHGFFMGFFYSSLHHDSYSGSIMPSLHFLFHELVSMFKILLNFSSGLIYLVQDISHAHLFLRFQQGSCKRLPSFSRKDSHCKDKSLAERLLCSPENLVYHSVPGTIKGLVSHVFIPALRK